MGESRSGASDTDGVPGTVGVVGVGMIGTGIVRGLLADGRVPEVFDTDEDAVRRAVATGAHAGSSVSELASRCSVVLVCVVSAEQVAAVVGEIVEASAGRDAPTVVVHSTIGVDAVKAIAGDAHGAVVIDAPVSDNRGEDVHRLFAFVGARHELPPLVTHALRSYCHGFEVVGDVGAGQLVKLVCNVISLVTTSAVTEALALCAASGVDPEVAAAAAMHGSASSWVLANRAKLAPRPAIVRKDLTAALDAAGRQGLEMPVTAAAREASELLFGRATPSD